MKIAALILANIAIVAGGIVTYDALKGPDGGVPADVAAMDRLAARLDTLESRVGKLGTDDGERRMTNRLLQVEGRVADLEARRLAPAAAVAADSSADPHASPGAVAIAGGTAADVLEALKTADDETLGAVVAKMEEVRDRQRASEMIGRMTDRLGLSLTDEQKTQVATALGDFRDSMRQKFRDAREQGVPREDMGALMEEARAELSTTLATFLPQQDAESIAATVGGDMGGRGPGRGGPGGGRGR